MCMQSNTLFWPVSQPISPHNYVKTREKNNNIILNTYESAERYISKRRNMQTLPAKMHIYITHLGRVRTTVSHPCEQKQVYLLRFGLGFLFGYYSISFLPFGGLAIYLRSIQYFNLVLFSNTHEKLSFDNPIVAFH